MVAKGFKVDGPESAALFDIAANNLEEELHGVIERKAIPHLDLLRGGDIAFLFSQEDFAMCCYYICEQFMRTRNRRERMLAAFADVDLGTINLDASWGLMRHMLATTVGYNLCMRRDQLSWTILQSPLRRLITADQPVINLSAVGVPEGKEVDDFALYYPLSPTRALLIEDNQPSFVVGQRDISPEEATEYNSAMLNQSYEQVYAMSQEDLE